MKRIDKGRREYLVLCSGQVRSHDAADILKLVIQMSINRFGCYDNVVYLGLLLSFGFIGSCYARRAADQILRSRRADTRILNLLIIQLPIFLIDFPAKTLPTYLTIMSLYCVSFELRISCRIVKIPLSDSHLLMRGRAQTRTEAGVLLSVVYL